MTPLYWQVYLNLEREFLSLADVVFINDFQQDVYSMRIADLLIRTAVEIEALAKELYLANDGPVMPDSEMYFDTVCMAHLNKLWHLEDKIVYVVSPNIYLEKEENKVLRPLKKAHCCGDRSADWNKAYQAVKHNRVKELKKGSIKNFLHGLAALYILNLYYKDEQIIKLTYEEKSTINPSFGSSLFSIKIHVENGLPPDGKYSKRPDYDECVFIEEHEPESKRVALDATNAVNEYAIQNTKKAIIKLVEERIAKGEAVTKEWAQKEFDKLFFTYFTKLDQKLYDQLRTGLSGIRYNVVLNKHQY